VTVRNRLAATVTATAAEAVPATWLTANGTATNRASAHVPTLAIVLCGADMVTPSWGGVVTSFRRRRGPVPIR
jgi:hypothetical protein